MFVIAKTKLSFDNSWLKSLKFEDHTDYDLKGNCFAIAIKSGLFIGTMNAIIAEWIFLTL